MQTTKLYVMKSHRYTLQDIMSQAKQDSYTAILDGNGYEARALYGCKISMDLKTYEVQLQNTARGGNWYIPLTEKEINIFLENGWRIGIYTLSLSNYRTKLNSIESFIKTEMNGKKNPKQIRKLKTSRERVLENYSNIIKKLNQIKNGKVKDSKH